MDAISGQVMSALPFSMSSIANLEQMPGPPSGPGYYLLDRAGPGMGRADYMTFVSGAPPLPSAALVQVSTQDGYPVYDLAASVARWSPATQSAPALSGGFSLSTLAVLALLGFLLLHK